MKNIYILHSCDIWKSRDSMRIVMATTSVLKLKQEIKRQLKKDWMEYSGDKKEVSLLNTEFVYEINKFLDYGYIEILENGKAV